MAHFTIGTCARCDGTGLVRDDRDCAQCTDGKIYTYENPRYARFVADLEDSNAVRHDAYRGRPAVRVESREDVDMIAQQTDVAVRADFIGLGALVYPV